LFYKRKKGPQTAPFVDTLPKKIRITHRFHPLFNQEFDLVSYRRTWLKETIDCFDKNKKLITVLLDWTDAAEEDPFVILAKGKSCFRTEDLIRLVDLIDELNHEEGPISRQKKSQE